jgi:CRISPR-associated Csx2 family protein
MPTMPDIHRPSRVFVSFLGTGGYEPCTYRLGERDATPTRYVQRALVEVLGPATFDRLVLLVTPEAKEKHGTALCDELGSLDGLRVTPELLSISENIHDPAVHWAIFEQLRSCVTPGDRLVLDVTHGFRAAPILASAALSYLKHAANIEVAHIFYGAFEAKGALVDMRDFFEIQRWAEAVGRLIDTADARLLATLAREADPRSTFAGLRALAEPFEQLTDVLRNVDAHRIERATRDALAALDARLPDASPAERQLLELVREKFGMLITTAPLSDHYGPDYLRVQLAASRILLDHGLLMQAFTLLRELVGSLGMLGLRGTDKDHSIFSSKGRKARAHAEVFLRMVVFARAEWKFSEESDDSNHRRLTSWYETLARAEIIAPLKETTGALTDLRNGFDHAWTAKANVPGNVTEQAFALHASLTELVERAIRIVEASPSPMD